MQEDNWKRKLRKELDKVRGMEPAQRWDYFKTYYAKMSIVALLVLICMLSCVFQMIHNAKHKPLLTGVFVNTSIDQQGELLLKKEFPASLSEELNPKHRGTVEYAADYIEYGDTEYQMDRRQHEMALAAQAAVGEIDFLVMDKPALDGMEGAEIYTEVVDITDVSEKLGIKPRECYLVFTYREDKKEKAAIARELKEFVLGLQQ